MKKIFYASLAVTVLISTALSCKKKVTTPFTYIVNGLTDITVAQNDSISVPVQVQTLTGSPEAVTLSLSGLPANMNATITPNTGTPNYNAVIKFKPSTSVPTGTTLITVNSNSSSTGTKPYNINLTVTPASLKNYLVGTWVWTSYVSDANNDGVMDDQVINATSSEILSFNENGTGTDVLNSQTYQFTWNLSGSDGATLNFIENGSTGSDHIDQVNATQLILKSSISTPITWAIYSKQ